MGSFWKIDECIEAKNGISYLHPTDGDINILVSDYETALENSDTNAIATMDSYLAYKGFEYLLEVPESCVVPEED